MALEGLRGYLVLASGLTEVSRQRAREVAQSLVSSTSGLDQAIRPLGKQAQQITEELIATSRSNRDLFLALVRSEVERGIAVLGLPSHEEVARLERRLARVERAVAEEGSPARPTRKVSSPPKKAGASTPQKSSTATKKGSTATKKSVSGEQGSTSATKKSTPAKKTRPVTAATKPGAPGTPPTLVRPELDFAAAAPVDGAVTTASDPDQAVGGTA